MHNFVLYIVELLFPASGLQQFIEQPQDLNVIKGQTAVLRCAVENRVGLIQWGKGSINPIMLGKHNVINMVSKLSNVYTYIVLVKMVRI